MTTHLAGDIFNREPVEPVFDIVGNGIEMRPHNYYIQWDRIDSYPKLAAWLVHLSEKNWITTQHLHDLIKQTEGHFGWPHQHTC